MVLFVLLETCNKIGGIIIEKSLHEKNLRKGIIIQLKIRGCLISHLRVREKVRHTNFNLKLMITLLLLEVP